MQTTDTRLPAKDEAQGPSGAGGPTSPSPSDAASRKAPKTGTYDDRPAETPPANEKGGYGAG